MLTAIGGWTDVGLAAGDSAPASSDLFAAIRAGDRAVVDRVIKAGTDLEARDGSGQTPLMAAALDADAAIVKRLLQAGAAVNATNAAGATALMRAATFEDKARLLVEAGADVRASSVLGNTALLLAARRPGNERTVRLLLERGADVNRANAFGATPLMAAAAARDLATVRLLLGRGADIDARPAMDPDGFIWGGGRTALQWAAFLGDEPMLQLLLERGAKVDQFTVVGGALAQAAWGGHPGVARRLLDAGAAVDQRDLIANYTPLHWAASSEHASPALVELLIARGADVQAEGGQPVDNFLGATETPVSLARKRGDTPIVRALLRSGATAPAGGAAAPVHRAKAGHGAEAGSDDDAIHAAVGRALDPLIRTAEQSVGTFRRHASRQECVSCHQQQLPLTALSLAGSRGLPTDRAAVRRQIELLQHDMSSVALSPRDSRWTALEMNRQATFHPEAAVFAGYATLPFELERVPASAATDAMAHQLATTQQPDGHWSWNLPRPPIQGSDLGATALAVHVLTRYGIPARRDEMNSRVRRARAWLAGARVETGEERVHQLLGLAWAGESAGRLERLARELILQQRPDGGWAQLAGLDSDAYATGQALYALLEAGGVSPGHPAVRRGVDFLVRSQLADGTWRVRRRAHPFQPPMDSGFAHGADGWISSAGTSWAVMALARALPAGAPKKVEPLASAVPAAGSIGTPGVAVAGNAAGRAVDGVGAPVEFGRDIQPVLERSCVACHSGERAKGGYVVTDRASLLRGGARGEPVVVPGQPAGSPLIRMIEGQVEDLEMPPVGRRAKFPALNPEEIERFKAWVSQGALWPADAGARTAAK